MNTELLAPKVGEWHHEMRQAIREIGQLCNELDLSDHVARAEILNRSAFPLFVPRPFLRRMEAGNMDDPLLRQVLPLRAEDVVQDGFVDDPVGDLISLRSTGLLQKYNGRALLVTTGACPVHCRYCFRRHFPYHETPKSPVQWLEPIQEIATDRSIDEILLSGGDPLSIVDQVLSQLVEEIESIPHVKRLRIHTRFPIMIPSRIDRSFLRIVGESRLQIFMVIHSNHPNEIDDEVVASFDGLRQANVTLLNQSVLLRGVNDSASVLVELSRKLIDSGVLPYYLHQLDRVNGAAHFEVNEQTGRKIIEQMRSELPGYAVPRYVREDPGKPSKTVLL